MQGRLLLSLTILSAIVISFSALPRMAAAASFILPGNACTAWKGTDGIYFTKENGRIKNTDSNKHEVICALPVRNDVTSEDVKVYVETTQSLTCNLWVYNINPKDNAGSTTNGTADIQLTLTKPVSWSDAMWYINCNLPKNATVVRISYAATP